MDDSDKLKDFTITDDGKIDDIQIVNAEFAKGKSWNVLIKKLGYKEDDYKELGNKFIKEIDTTVGTHLFAYVEVKDNGTVTLRCFIHCIDANSIYDNYGNYKGLFQESKATKIEILSCGSKIENMSYMFYNCHSLTNIIFHDKFNTNKVTDMSGMFYNCSSLKNINLSNFNTDKVTNMSNMFYNCSSLNNLDLSKFNTDKVTDMGFMFNDCSSLTVLDLSSFNTTNVKYMSCMFDGCSSLTKLDLSHFITDNVTDMIWMFNNCFKEKQTSTLICQASTIQEITENKNSRLTITNENENNNKINNTLNKNPKQVYKCSVKKVGSNPEITEVEEHK